MWAWEGLGSSLLVKQMNEEGGNPFVCVLLIFSSENKGLKVNEV